MPVEDYAKRAGRMAAKAVAREPLKGTSLSYGWGDPEKEAESHEVNCVHVPARSPLAVVILSECPVRYFGHWAGRTMRLCPGPDTCPFCARGMGGQHRYAFSVYLPDTGAKSFLEAPASFGLEILRICEKTGTSPGDTRSDIA